MGPGYGGRKTALGESSLTEDGEGDWFWRKDEMFASSGTIKQALGLEVITGDRT